MLDRSEVTFLSCPTLISSPSWGTMSLVRFLSSLCFATPRQDSSIFNVKRASPSPSSAIKLSTLFIVILTSLFELYTSQAFVRSSVIDSLEIFLNLNVKHLDRIALFTSSLVLCCRPINLTCPSSIAGNRTSCWPLFSLWISSTNNICSLFPPELRIYLIQSPLVSLWLRWYSRDHRTLPSWVFDIKLARLVFLCLVVPK